MKRIVMWVMSTITALVLLFGYHTSTSGAQQSSAIGPAVPGVSGQLRSSGKSAAAGSAHGSGHKSAAGPRTAASVVTGPVAQTQWGPVQVQITVAGGQITKVAVPQYPNGNGTDAQINAYALPRLVRETLTAQSAQIQMISGATITSGGYVQSLQGAIDQAGL